MRGIETGPFAEDKIEDEWLEKCLPDIMIDFFIDVSFPVNRMFRSYQNGSE